MFQHHRHGILPCEGRPPGQDFEHDGAEGVEVRQGRRSRSLDHFRGDVGGGAGDGPFQGGSRSRIDGPGEVEVGDFHGAIVSVAVLPRRRGAQEDVRRFEITVQDVIAVNVFEAVENPRQDIEIDHRRSASEPDAPSEVLEGFTPHVFHDDIPEFFTWNKPVYFDDTRVIEGCRDPELAFQAIQADFQPRGRLHGFYRSFLPEFRVETEEHFTGAAASEARLQRYAAPIER